MSNLFKRTFKFLKPRLFTLAVILLVSFSMLFIVLKGPQIHSKYMRSYVGSKVVSIYGGKSGGTGFHVTTSSGEIYILTNNHICNLADSHDTVKVIDSTGRSFKRRVLARHPSHDLCLVEGMPGYSGLNVASYVELGEIVGIVGHPGLRPLSLARGEIIGESRVRLVLGTDLPKERCFGEIIDISQTFIGMLMNAKTACLVDVRATMFNGIAYGGNSGSPVVDFYGNVIGVLFAGSQQVTDSYLVPLDVVRDFLESY